MNNTIKKASLLLAIATQTATLCGQTLAEAYAGYWHTGVSVNQWEVEGSQEEDWQLITDNYNAVVAENCMKMESVHPREGVYDFTTADKFVDKAVAAGLRVHGHVLVWHSQCPQWFHRDKDGNLVSREVLKERLRQHIYTVVSHFRGRVASWDVVNEAFNDDGTLRQSLFYKILGEDYIPLAFQYAHEADPTAELYYNDYSMHVASKVEGVCRFFKPLIDKGLPVTAIGMQGHMSLADSKGMLGRYQHSIDCITATGVKTFFSEVDLSVLPSPWGWSGANVSDRFAYREEMDPYRNGITKQRQKEFDDFMVDFYRMLIRNKQHILRVNYWCVNDGNSWLNGFPIKGRTDYPTLIGRDKKIKPVVKRIINLVK